jgi:gliding motility-associated protein GldM
MSSGKQTPRQKMIGMMYLVLTALLALNVQKDVLNAFAIVDEGLTKMNENYVEKNNEMYNNFEQAAIQNPGKAKKWKDLAFQVKELSNKIDKHLQDLKVDIIKKADGDKAKALAEGKIESEKIEGKDITDKPAEIMIVKGNGKKVREEINYFRQFLLDNIDPKAEGIVAAVKKGLNTDDPKPVGGKTESWESEHFEHLPLSGVIAIMSGLQANVRNAESDMLRYLYSMIDKNTFKFTNLEATVIHNSNYVIQGNDYQAKVFIAAFDTTKNPSIYIGPYDSVRTEDGSYEYKLKPGYNYDSLPTKKGKGLYTRPGRTIGVNRWSGIIKLDAPGGGLPVLRPFRAEYQVAEPMLVVSPTKLNLFYLSIDNPVDISVPSVGADKITATINNGTINRVGAGYIVRPARVGQSADVTVYAEIDKKKQKMGTKSFRVRMVPDPVAKVAGIKGNGSLDKNRLLIETGVFAIMENFEFDLEFKVSEFTVSAVSSGFTNEKRAKGNKFTPEQMALIKTVNKGQNVSITDIKAVGPDGSVRPLGPIILKLK